MPLHLRLDKEALNSNANLVSTVVKWVKDPSQLLIVQEQQSTKTQGPCKPHYHIYIPDGHLSVPTIRTRIRDMCSEICKTTKKHNYYRIETVKITELALQGYCLKFPDNIVVYQGSEVDTEAAKEEYGKKSKSKKVNGQNTRLEIEKYLEDKTYNSPVELARLVRKYYDKQNKIYHKAEMAKIVQTMWYKDKDEITSFDEQVCEEAQCGIGKIEELQQQLKQYRLHFQRTPINSDIALAQALTPKAV